MLRLGGTLPRSKIVGVTVSLIWCVFASMASLLRVVRRIATAYSSGLGCRIESIAASAA